MRVMYKSLDNEASIKFPYDLFYSITYFKVKILVKILADYFKLGHFFVSVGLVGANSPNAV